MAAEVAIMNQHTLVLARQRTPLGHDQSNGKTEAEKAETLREYQKLLDQIDDIFRELIERRTGVR
jgi:hypothetical protein